MRRLPSWLYRPLERLYFEQRSIRQREAKRRLAEEGRVQRAFFDQLRSAHRAGTCVEGCPYVPCTEPVDGRQLPPPCGAGCTEHRKHRWNGQPVPAEEAW